MPPLDSILNARYNVLSLSKSWCYHRGFFKLNRIAKMLHEKILIIGHGFPFSSIFFLLGVLGRFILICRKVFITFSLLFEICQLQQLCLRLKQVGVIYMNPNCFTPMNHSSVLNEWFLSKFGLKICCNLSSFVSTNNDSWKSKPGVYLKRWRYLITELNNPFSVWMSL